MSLTLSEAETLVRRRTRHPDATDPRALPEAIKGDLNREYKKLRVWLETVAPELYLKTSGDIVFVDGVTNEINLTSSCGTFSTIDRVDRQYEASNADGFVWRKLDSAPTQQVNGRHITYRREGNCLILGPDLCTGGTYRVVFHVIPPDLANPDDLFLLPPELEDALILRAMGWQLLGDGDGAAAKKDCDDLAESDLTKAAVTLRRQYGRANKEPGLRR